MQKLLSAALLFSAAVFGSDVSGKWSGPLELTRGDEKRSDTAFIILKQEGNTLTGSIGPRESKQLPITKGTIEGETIYIEAAVPEKDAKMVLRLKKNGEKLTGELKGEGAEAERGTGTMELSKVN